MELEYATSNCACTVANMHVATCTVVLAALSLPLITTHAFPDGAPLAVCYAYHGSRVISPKHPAGNANDAPGGYFIDSDLRDTSFFFDTSKQTYTSKRTIDSCSV